MSMKPIFSVSEQKDVIDLLELILYKDLPFEPKLLIVQRMCESLLYEIKARKDASKK